MMAAAVAGQRGLRVVLIEHASRLAEKIRISGGGRCNFTNVGTTAANFISQNTNFCRSALSAYQPKDFIALVNQHGIAWHEKHKGQLFCDDSSEQIIQLLTQECQQGNVTWRMPCSVSAVTMDNHLYRLATTTGPIVARQLVLATGGMAIPQLGATDFSLTIARQFGLKIIEPRPALVPLTFDPATWSAFGSLSGLAIEVSLSSDKTGAAPRQGQFLEDLLFTHRGLSGPAILQISSFWNPGEPIHINLAPEQDLERDLLAAKSGSKQQLGTVLSGLWPRRLAEAWLQYATDLEGAPGVDLAHLRLADVPDKVLRRLAQHIHRWSLVPSGTAGYKKAEVMRGGVDTRAINSKTMQVKAVPGLYLVGEALDVTGWLGGYNFQWAWASGVACGKALTAA